MSAPVRRLLAVLVAVMLVVGLTPLSAMGAHQKVGGMQAQVIYTADGYESDNTTATAKVLPEASLHNFHNDLDEDWSIISADATGQAFMLETIGRSGLDFDSEIHVWSMDASGNAVADIASNDDSGLWSATYSSDVYFTAPEPGDYYVQIIQNLDGDLGEYMLYEGRGIARRVSGANRYATAAQVSMLEWSQTNNVSGYGTNGPTFVVIASGENFADALAGSTLAMLNDGVLLLTTGGKLAPDTKAELARLLYSEDAEVYVLGGTGAISAETYNAIGQAGAGVKYLERVAGANRYDTAVKAALLASETAGIGTTAFIANGMQFADALAAGPVAAYAGAPILLTGMSDLPAETAAFLDDANITDVYVCGGEGSIDASAFAEIESIVGAGNVTRVAGDTRYDTAFELASLGVDTFGMSGGAMVLASGATFADGLAAGTICWWTGGPLLLTPPTELSEAVYDFVGIYGVPTASSFVVGGTGAVSQDTYLEFQDLWAIDL